MMICITVDMVVSESHNAVKAQEEHGVEYQTNMDTTAPNTLKILAHCSRVTIYQNFHTLLRSAVVHHW